MITVEYILPLLMDELVHGQTEFSPIILPSVIIIGSHLPPERFSKEISPLITQLFGRKDRATRLQRQEKAAGTSWMSRNRELRSRYSSMSWQRIVMEIRLRRL